MNKVLIWGVGNLYKKIKNSINWDQLKLVGYVESEQTMVNYENQRIYLPCELKNLEYDYLIIANTYTDECLKLCSVEKIDFVKILPIHPTKTSIIVCGNSNKSFFKDLLFDEIENKKEKIRNMVYIQRPAKSQDIDRSWIEDFDYVRDVTLNLIYGEIIRNKIDGCVAELGVFRGEFAKKINYLFYDRKICLFDTFEGFNEDEVGNSIRDGFITLEWSQEFKDTSINTVLKKMHYPDQCEFYKGFFPQSAKEVCNERKYAFVSLDVDLEESTLEGLRYFYPKLQSGGYIMMHDYFLGGETCCSRALDRYESEIGKICKVPIGDAYGTLVINKN